MVQSPQFIKPVPPTLPSLTKQDSPISTPQSVDGFAKHGTVSKITGKDGVVRDKLEIPGSYRGKKGVFEYIREPNGNINHRLFVPNEN